MKFEVKQISKSRWIVVCGSQQISKHASLADAERAAGNYGALQIDGSKLSKYGNPK
jgi:hypothetical protein